MEKLEFQKNLEKKRAYVHFMMIFMCFLVPTLLSVFKKINVNTVTQLAVFALVFAIICFFYFMAQSLEVRIDKIKTQKNQKTS